MVFCPLAFRCAQSTGAGRPGSRRFVLQCIWRAADTQGFKKPCYPIQTRYLKGIQWHPSRRHNTPRPKNTAIECIEDTAMNTKAVYAACLFAALNICTLSARAESHVPIGRAHV